ncbi:MAG: hypothetical protein ACK4F9_07925, partial [Brevinematia bacterium]
MKYSIVLVLFLLVFVVFSCYQNVNYIDTRGPDIFVFLPVEGSVYYGKVPIKVQVNEVYEQGKESGLKNLEIKIFKNFVQEYFKTNISLSGNEANINFYVNILPYNHYRLVAIVSDNYGNVSQKEVKFISSPSPILHIYFITYYYATNTNVLEFFGGINITREYYGDVSSVKLIVSNSLGVFTNDVDSFNDNSWFFSAKPINLKEVGSNFEYNIISVLLTTTSNNFTNASFTMYYDTNKPFTTILDPSS